MHHPRDINKSVRVAWRLSPDSSSLRAPPRPTVSVAISDRALRHILPRRTLRRSAFSAAVAPKGKRNASGRNKPEQAQQRATMRSWPDENGSAMLSDHEPPHQYFTLEKAREIVTDESSQVVKIPAAGFLNAISRLVAGQEVLKCVPSEKPECDDFAKLMLWEARQLLCDKDVLKAMDALHLPFEKFENKRSAEKAAKVVIEHFGSKDKASERLAVLGRLADGSDGGDRAHSACDVCKGMSKKIPEQEKQPASIRKFLKSQKMDDLIAALASGAAAAAEKTVRKKRYAFGEDLKSSEKSTSGSSSSKSSDSDGDSSDGSKSKDKKKRKDNERDKSSSPGRSRSRSKGNKDKKNKKK